MQSNVGAGLLAMQAPRSIRHTALMLSQASPLPQKRFCSWTRAVSLDGPPTFITAGFFASAALSLADVFLQSVP
ncbi:hypothetical protein F0170_02175 [Pseudomonas sp. MAFF 730085]|uniref:Uncharacterized protein n=1 Tax=Pseudomonas kitaguniensis TaxID=2607908 RepID=A0A5N7JNK6_9PSED|nr:hypothetical protein [Pseudomonas kitaguniensis]